MKKILLLGFIMLFTFSCTEYGDDGLPSGGAAILNPDGTKRLKRVVNDLNIIQEMSLSGFPSPIITTTETHTETDYNRYDYGFVTVATTSTDIAGFGDMGGGEEPATNTNSVMTSTAEFDDGQLSELIVESNAEEQMSTARTVYSYENDRVSRITIFEDNEQYSTSELTYNDDNIIIEIDYNSDDYADNTMTLSIADSLISSISIANSLNEIVTDIALTRDGLNLIQANISRNGESLLSTYSYDDAHYYKHNLGSWTDLEDRMMAEAISLAQLHIATTSDQDPLLINIEAGLRGLLDLATNNLTSRSIDGETVEMITYTYDEDNYPITISIDMDSMIDISNILGDLADTMLANFIASGLSEEEAQAQLEMFLEMFSDSDSTTEITNYGTIEYYD